MSIRRGALEEQLSTIASLMETLEMDRCSTLSEDILNVDTEGAVLSDDYLTKREHVINSLRDQLTENKHVSQELKRDVTRLHRLIHRDQPIPDTIEHLFHSSKPSNISQLREILTSLNKMKNDNLDKYLVGLEEEISIFHKLCFQTKCELSSEESIEEKSDILKATTSTLDITEIIIDDVIGSKESFVICNAEISREAQVRNLEEELESWESFYQSNKCIFELIAKWKELNDKYLAMETPSPDKYNNRGGCLLRMQKEAARLLREIPKLEAEILSEVEKLNGETIKINGLFVEDYFSEYRATTSLNRQSSIRRSRRKSTNKSKVESVKKTEEPPCQLKANPGVRRSMRKSVRESRDGLDKIKK